jgi:regulation of enolase protein 1 (concanavalin A-like superfamily)
MQPRQVINIGDLMKSALAAGLAIFLRGATGLTAEPDPVSSQAGVRSEPLEQSIFEDNFSGRLGDGWDWIREDPKAWRITEQGLAVRIQPGNMWGPQNDAHNLLVRSAPEPTNGTILVSVQVENSPSHQYEQTDLVWYYDDSNMVKLGQELVDGRLSIVMGREEKDQTRTVAIIPLASTRVRLRLLVKGSKIRGQFRTAEDSDWQEVGQCELPVEGKVASKICLQFYQGAESNDHWAQVTNFRLARNRQLIWPEASK